jgi:hypothetical protein
MAIPPPHRKRFLPLWVGYVGRRSTCVKRTRGCSRALSHTPAVSVHSQQGAGSRGKRAVWLQNGISLSLNTAQPHCLPTREGAVETANACTLARFLLADVCRLLACSGPRDEESEACGGAGLGRMMEVSRKKWKGVGQHSPSVMPEYCAAPGRRSGDALFFSQHSDYYITLPPTTT